MRVSCVCVNFDWVFLTVRHTHTHKHIIIYYGVFKYAPRTNSHRRSWGHTKKNTKDRRRKLKESERRGEEDLDKHEVMVSQI